MTRAKYVEKRLILLDQFVERIGRICCEYMPPAGQDAMQAQWDAYREAIMSLGDIPTTEEDREDG